MILYSMPCGTSLIAISSIVIVSKASGVGTITQTPPSGFGYIILWFIIIPYWLPKHATFTCDVSANKPAKEVVPTLKVVVVGAL